MLCTAKHCSLRSRKPKLYGDDMKSSYSKITAAMEKLLHFWVDISHKRPTNSTGKRANWINYLLNILKVLFNLHKFPLLNINCTEPYLGPLYIEAMSSFKFLTVRSLKEVSSMEQYIKGFQGFTPVKMCGLSPLASFLYWHVITPRAHFWHLIETKYSLTVNH